MGIQPALPLMAVLLASAPSNAEIVGGDILQQTGAGQFTVLTPSPGLAVGADTFDDDNLYAFAEVQNIVLPDAVAVDLGAPEGSIPAGTRVSSHYVFFDSLDSSQFGFVQFDGPILGIALSQGTMAATDHIGHPAVTYLSPDLRGLETGDEVWIDETDPTRLYVLWAGSSPGDYIRVFTAAPATPMM